MGHPNKTLRSAPAWWTDILLNQNRRSNCRRDRRNDLARADKREKGQDQRKLFLPGHPLCSYSPRRVCNCMTHIATSLYRFVMTRLLDHLEERMLFNTPVDCQGKGVAGEGVYFLRGQAGGQSGGNLQ